MPRVVKPKVTAAAAKKPAGGKNKNKLYVMPEPIPLNTVLADLSKTQWKVGPSIGTGGFGEIYSACKVGEKNYDYVVKCEPHGNGPLFVEMHFYMRNAKLDDIQRFKKEHGLKALGMPYMLGNGSHDLNGQKHRFIVMPRYGSDIARFFISNGGRLPEPTIYRLALQMIDVYKFVHSCGYVHADLKGANILLGYGKTGGSQAYLVDYGLASHYTTKDFKPDPKKMHNGTIEYTSRDAHQGVATMRADLEILGYNLIEWSGVKLPWVRDNLLATPIKVQQAKVDFMENIGANLKKLYPNGAPVPIAELMKYVATMKYNDTPDYERCKKIFLTALKSLKSTNSGDLDFKLKTTANYSAANVVETDNKHKTKVSKTKPVSVDVNSSHDEDSDGEEICSSDDDTDVIFEQKKPKHIVNKKPRPFKTGSKIRSPQKRSPLKNSPSPPQKRPAIHQKVNNSSPSPSPTKRRCLSDNSPTPPKRQNISTKSPSPLKRKHIATHNLHTPKLKNLKDAKKVTNTTGSGSRQKLRSTPLSTSTNLNFSPSISVATSSSKPGKTVINDNLTPNAKAGKTYEFNFELDVSMDANVVVNVKRKKKPRDVAATNRTPTRSATNGSRKNTDVESEESPATRVKVRKLQSDSASNSPMLTPAVTLKKTKNFIRSPC